MRELAGLDPDGAEARRLTALRDELHYDQGRVMLAMADEPGRRQSERLELFEQAIATLDSIPKSDYQARHLLGRTYDQLDQAADADAAFRACIELEPRYTPCYVGLADLYHDFGVPELATEVLAAGTKVRAKDVHMWLGAARIEYQLGHHAEAIAAGLEARALDPDILEVHYFLGLAYAGQDERAEGIESLTTFLTMAGDEVPNSMRHFATDALMRMQDIL